VPVELLRFFDKFTPNTPSQQNAPGSLADFGGDDVETEEAQIESGAPLSIPEVPDIPELPGADAGLDKVATDAAPEATKIAVDGHAQATSEAHAGAEDSPAGSDT